MKAYWKGQIRLSLVSFGVEIYSALDRGSSLQMNKIHEPSGKRVHYQNVVEGKGPVPREEIVSGYEYKIGKYVLIDPDEIKELQIESSKVIDVVQFVDAHEVPDLYIEKPYYVVPDNNDVSKEAYEVMKQALCKANKVGIGQMTRGGREYLIALKPCFAGLLLETLRYEDEVKDASEFYKERKGKLDKEMLDLAATLIERKSSPFNPAKFTDHYKKAFKELIDAKIHDRKLDLEIHDEEPKGNVVNLMDALKRSVAGGKLSGGKKPAPAAKKKAKANPKAKAKAKPRKKAA